MTLAARDIARRDSMVDMKYRQIFSTYVDQMTAEWEAPAVQELCFVAHYLERIGDRSRTSPKN